MPDPEPTPQWRRLHPSTILVEVVQKVLSLAWFIAIVLLLLYFGGEPDKFEVFLALAALLQVMAPIHAYLTLRYAVQGDKLLIRSGFLFKRMRTIALDRVQHINLQRGLLHRFFRVVELKVETAAGGKAEAKLAVVSEEEAENLRRQLLERGTGNAELGTTDGSDGSQPRVPSSELLWSATWKELLLLGATENRIALIFGGFFAINQFVPNFQPLTWIGNWIESRFEHGDSWMGVTLWVAAGIIALFLLGVLVSIVMTFFTHHGFTLRRADGKLRRRYGLFTQHETMLPVKRVQVVRIDQPLLRRLMGYATLYVESAGTPVTEEAAGAGTTALCPLLRRAEIGRFIRLLFDDLELESVDWKPVSRHTIRRAFAHTALFQLILLLILCVYFTWFAGYAIPAVLLVAGWFAVARYRGLGYAERGGYLLVRAGVLTRRIWIVPCSKIQGLTISRSPSQRRFGIANLAIATAGMGLGHHPNIFDLPLPTAREMGDRLSASAHAAGEWLLDGA